MTILDRLDSNWSREEREKINDNWTIIESYLSNLQGQINFLTGNVNVQELIEQLKSLLSQGTIILDELKSALINVEEIIVDAQNATNNANDAAQSALNAVNDIQSMLDNFQVRGTYDNDTVYSKNNSVFYEGSSYVYTNNTPNKGNPPPNYPTVANDHWQMTAAKGASGDGAVSKVNGKEPDGEGEVILTASDVGAASAEQLEQLEQTTENHITDSTKHLQDGERNKINNALQPSTYNASNTITNVGANRATRVFPQISWRASAGTPELWESILIMTKPVWGILELDIAGYSAASGGAKIVVEIGISVPNDTTSPSVGFRNEMKVVTASAGFTDNFYIRVEHRPSARYLILQVFKRIYNDPVSVVATFTSTVSPQAAFEMLKGFSEGAYYSNGISAPTELQKDFDTRITENFTLVSNGKAVVNQAVTDMGVTTAPDAPFATTAANIRAIQTQISVKGEIPLSPIPSNGLLEVYTPWFDFQPMYFSSTLPGMSLYNGYATPQISTATNAFYILSMDTYNQAVNGVLQWRLKLLIKNAYSFTSTQNKMDYFISK